MVPSFLVFKGIYEVRRRFRILTSEKLSVSTETRIHLSVKFNTRVIEWRKLLSKLIILERYFSFTNILKETLSDQKRIFVSSTYILQDSVAF
jgi:hypothetical protein